MRYLQHLRKGEREQIFHGLFFFKGSEQKMEK